MASLFNSKLRSVYLFVLFGGLGAVIYSLVKFPLELVDWKLVLLSLITVFGSSKLHFQLPRMKLHFSTADVLILYAALRYGVSVAVILALCESLFSTYYLKTQGLSVKNKTFALNAALHTLTIFITSATIYAFFDPSEIILVNTHYEFIIVLMLAMTVAQFSGNTFLAAAFAAERTGKPYWKLWNETFINLGLLYLAESILAVLLYKVIDTLNPVLIFAAVGFAGLIYFTYRRYVNEVISTSQQAEQAERERLESEKLRAEQAENHVSELKTLLTEQERISQELLKSKDQFRYAAFHDNLTGLPNRNAVEDNLNPVLRELKTDPEKTFAVLYVDLNRFKHINESLGYALGNEMLKMVAGRLTEIAGEENTVARFSSDEFVLVINSITREETILNKTDEIEKRISEVFVIDGRRIFTTPSIGIAVSNTEYKSVDEILRDAEIAMYNAKEKNKTYAVFNRMMHDAMLERIEVESDLRRAIKNNEFCLYYQPIVDLETLEISGFEALIRWNHPQKGLVAPYKFIPIAEDTGLIIPMTDWILREACRQTKVWQSEFKPELTISVNISGKHFAQSDLVGSVDDILTATQISPSRLKLEITESAAMEDAERTILILQQLKNLGVKLMIDDFGTGYSSLNYLHKFPIDTLKVDRSFVSILENPDENNEIVNTIILMAKNLRLDVIAEGIETNTQLTRLADLNCDRGQGYYFSRPITPEQVENLLKTTPHWSFIQSGTVPFDGEKIEVDSIQ